MKLGWWIGLLWVSAGLLSASVVMAAGWSNTLALEGPPGWSAITNRQEHSSWVPVAVLVRFAEPSSGLLTIWRASDGVEVELGRCQFTNALSVVWVPEAAYAFGFGDALRIGSTATNGVVQVIRKGGG